MDRETFGVENLLEPRRRTDWTEPHAEGEWALQLNERVGED